MSRLPPLIALRAFEAVARLGSVGKAALALNVTHPAISHQLRQLEEHLGQPLLQRQGRGVRATEAGLELSIALTDAFTRIEHSCDRLRTRRPRQTLVVACIASVASRWLIPRLPEFAQLHPDVDIRIVYAPIDTLEMAADIDLLITHCNGPYRGPYLDRQLLSGATRPVCSPALLDRLGPLDTPQALLGAPRLHDGDRHAWNDWFDRAGIADAHAGQGVLFEDFNLMSTAAIAGHGVALCPIELVQDDIGRGHLVVLSDISANLDRSYRVLNRRGGSAPAQAIGEWLVGLK